MKVENFSLKHISSKTALEMLMYVQMAGEFFCDENYVAKRKKYDSILIIATLSGKGYLKYGNKEYELVKGTGMIIDCNQPQVYFSDKKELWNFVFIHFKGERSTKLVKFILENSGPLFRFESNGIILNNINKIFDLLLEKGIYYDIIMDQFLNEIITDIVLKSLPGGNKNQNIPDTISKMISIIECNYSMKISMEDIAKKLYTSKYELIRNFKKYIGTTPYQYLIKYRINQSKILLENTMLPVSEIARKVSFEDSSYFIKVFRQHEKITPLKYKEYWNEGSSQV